MSKPRYKWWGYAKAIIRAYPEHCKALEERKAQSITVNYDAVGHSSTPGRTIEGLALKTLNPIDQKEYDAVDASVKALARTEIGQEKLRLISLVFFQKTHTLQGAAWECNVSYGTAKAWHNKFILSVAKNFGLY